MQQNGVRDDQVAQIRGYADQQLRKADSPQDPTNRRISLIIEYIIKDPATDAQKITEPEKASDPEKAKSLEK